MFLYKAIKVFYNEIVLKMNKDINSLGGSYFEHSVREWFSQRMAKTAECLVALPPCPLISVLLNLRAETRRSNSRSIEGAGLSGGRRQQGKSKVRG